MRSLFNSVTVWCIGSLWPESRPKAVRLSFALYLVTMLGSQGGKWRTWAEFCISLDAHIDSDCCNAFS